MTIEQPLPQHEDLLPPIRHLRLKAAALLLLTLALVLGAVSYLLYARGVFEPTQPLVLLAEDSEGVSVGMDVTFSGFPIGRVRRTELAQDGNVRILVDVAERDAHWLRESSVFTLVRGLVGGTAIKAYSGVLDDPPLPAGAVRPVLSGDTAAEIPQLMASARELLDNLQKMTATDAPVNQTLARVQQLGERINGPQGALGVLMGNDADARKVLVLLERSEALVQRLDTLVQRADRQVLGGSNGDAGLVAALRAAVLQSQALLTDARASLQRVDAVLAEAQAVGSNVRGATTDLDALRAEVEASLLKVDAMVSELQRKWPFARGDAELKLP
ncbi:hypothetical protein GCM10022279_29990 [Comamonas faecalis]|uniref:Mce/MlaD domain-containing protein n=1 Tax=Comamonas faecalis TaxID=1387849 RepID=A0ABP7RYP2_9BURK